MVLAEFKATRSQLLQVRKTLKMAVRGHRLLKLKRDALMLEFFQVLERAREVRSNIVDRYQDAAGKLAVASAIEGRVGVRSASYALMQKPELELTTRNVMGIVVPKIEAEKVRKRIDERGYGIIGTSPRIDAAAEATPPPRPTRSSWRTSSWRRRSRPPCGASSRRSRRSNVASTPWSTGSSPSWRTRRSSSRCVWRR
jgi:hypothetical protein